MNKEKDPKIKERYKNTNNEIEDLKLKILPLTMLKGMEDIRVEFLETIENLKNERSSNKIIKSLFEKIFNIKISENELTAMIWEIERERLNKMSLK